MHHIDPSVSLIKDEDFEFSKYLKDRILSIDIFDADSIMHFGTAKMQLSKVMRQGEKIISKGFDLEICESNHGHVVGHL